MRADKSLQADGIHPRELHELKDEIGMVGWQECGTCQCKWLLGWRGCRLTDVTLSVRAPRRGLGNYSTDESAFSLHLDQAGGNWKKEEKPVDFKITHRARNRWGVGARAATQGLPRATAPDGCPGVLRGPRG